MFPPAREAGSPAVAADRAGVAVLVIRTRLDARLTAERRSVSHVDSAGGDTLVRCFECVNPGVVEVSIGRTTSAAFARSWGLTPIIVLAIRVMSSKVTAVTRRHNARYEYLFGDQLSEITRLVENGAIKPLVEKVYSLEQVRDALAYSESGRVTGKVVIKVP